MKEENKKKLKDYEINLVTWNRGKYGKYKMLKKINKKAFVKQLKMSD